MNLPPRLQRNHELSDKVINDLRVCSRYKKVIKQADRFPIEPNRLVRFGYNPSIILDNGMITMAYRFHDGDTLQTRLALAQIDFGGKVVSNRSLPSKNGTSMEDPRLFWWQNKTWISWVESNYPTMPLASVVKYGQLLEGNIVSTYSPVAPNPRGMEKNWLPFPIDSCIQFIYATWPTQIIFQVVGNDVVQTVKTTGFRWPYGEPRGGTTPLPYRGKLLRFFHSSLDNEYASVRRRYYMGAVLMDSTEPWNPVACSNSPILYGNEDDTVPYSEWGKCRHRKPNVVFPLGAIPALDGNGWLVSVGVNDYQIEIMHIKPEQLNL